MAKPICHLISNSGSFATERYRTDSKHWAVRASELEALGYEVDWLTELTGPGRGFSTGFGSLHILPGKNRYTSDIPYSTISIEPASHKHAKYVLEEEEAA